MAKRNLFGEETRNPVQLPGRSYARDPLLEAWARRAAGELDLVSQDHAIDADLVNDLFALAEEIS